MSLFQFKGGDVPSDVAAMTQQFQVDTMIGIPSWQGGLDPETQGCLDKLCAHNVRIKNLITVKKAYGSLTATNRNNVVLEAINTTTKYILFLDTDMVFPADAIQRMKRHGKPVLSALAFSKGAPFVPNMYQRVHRVGWKPVTHWRDGELRKTDCVGGAFMLVEVDVFRKIDPPWFASPSLVEHVVWGYVEKVLAGDLSEEDCWKEIRRGVRDCGYDDPKIWGKQPALGEDYYFSEKLRRAGVPIYVDTALDIGHMGRHMFSKHDFNAQKKTGIFDDVNQKFGFGVGVD